MTNNVVNLNDYRLEKSEPNIVDDILEKTGMEHPSLDFMESMIGVLYDYDIDPQAPETAENMIFLSMLFQAHLDNMNDKENNLYAIFDLMRENVHADE